MPPFSHVPVLADAVLDAARQIPRADGLLIDATLGGGGHSALLLEQHPGLRLIGLDQDATARAAAAERLAPFGDRVSIVATNFADYVPPEPAVMVLADLGVSSPQLDVAERGFSFRLDGPLDMRMNAGGEGETAAELIDRLEENELADLSMAMGRSGSPVVSPGGSKPTSRTRAPMRALRPWPTPWLVAIPLRRGGDGFIPPPAPSRPCGLR